MNSVESVILETPEAEAVRAFYADAFGLDDKVQVRESDSRTTGFRGFTLLSLPSPPTLML
ncbi:hypothetical protein [Hoyosella sp. YIM 151337]|uniref:hypothetical protein n=1 Tax=Hoyosella sp. YIM 151337 TaxID=2992742 RepID=UPI0027DFCF5A|nr:hypothetical protein [Hoyosella sp. YIM 151337]